MKMPLKISIYITSYNQKHYLIEAIESVLNQTLKPYQIIIVDDCSTDGSQNIIAGYASRYPELITPIYHSQNQGVAQTRIHAMQAVTGDYATYVDGDDRILPTKLEKEAKLLQDNPHAQIAFSNYYYITENGIRTGIWADGETPPQGDVFRQTFAREFPRRNLFRNELVNYQAWKNIGFYDTYLGIYHDYEMRIRLTKQLQIVYYDEPLAEYRRCQSGVSSAKLIQHLAELEYAYKKNILLLKQLSLKEQDTIRRKLGEYLAVVARGAARQSLLESASSVNNRVDAIRYYLKGLQYQPDYLDYKLALRILLPKTVYVWIKSKYFLLKVKNNQL